jgi:uncharacterized damage-inducible protein DinB
MKSNIELANRFKEVIFDGKWIANTNYQEQLNDLSWQIATQKVANMNTIADLAQHIPYYIQGLNQVFNGGTLDIRDTYSFDFAPILSQADWEKRLQKFWNDSYEFASLIEKMTDDKLDSVFVQEKYGSYRRNIDAIIEHAYYHLGQIVLIKKMI